jgi:hypothetical protein
MSARNKLFLAMFAAAGLLAWLSTPSDIGRPIRIVGGVNDAETAALPKTTCAICLPRTMMVNCLSASVSVTNNPTAK